MYKTFNGIQLSLTCPSRFNLTQTNKLTVKSVEGIIHSFDSLLRVDATAFFKLFPKAHVHNLTATLWLCPDFSKQLNDTSTGLEIDKVIHTCHQRTVHHGTPCITLFVVISNVVALSSVALMISGKVIWLTCRMRKCSITFTCSCWLSLKSFQTLYEPSRWKTKQAILFSKPLQKFWVEAGWRRCFL